MDAQSLVERKPNRNIPDFRPGDTVRVHAKVIEGERERIQIFEGVVLRIRKRGPGSSFTVRRMSHGVGVERIFPIHSPLIDRVEVSKVGKVRRAKLYYLRDRVGRAARVRAGERSRFEALTAALPPEEPEEEEGLVAAEGAELEEGAEAAVEDTETTEGDAEEPSAEADSEAPPEAAADEAPAAEEVAEPEAKAEEPSPEEAAEEPAASEDTPEESAAPDEPPAEEDAPAEETPAEAEEESSDEKPAEGEADDSKE